LAFGRCLLPVILVTGKCFIQHRIAAVIAVGLMMKNMQQVLTAAAFGTAALADMACS
jgi:hypothetical protein